MIRLYFGRWGSIGTFRTAVKLPRLLRTLGDLGDSGVSDGPGTCVVTDTGVILGGEIFEFGTSLHCLSSTVEESSKQSVCKYDG